MNKIVFFLFCVLVHVVPFRANCQSQTIKLTQLQAGKVGSSFAKGLVGITRASDGKQVYQTYVNVSDNCISFRPLPTLNLTNLNEFVIKCGTDSIWYIDFEGRSMFFGTQAGGGGGSVADRDWLNISDNGVPLAIQNPIYTDNYAAINMKLVWPAAQLLVGDSSTVGNIVTAGNRESRIGFYRILDNSWASVGKEGASLTARLGTGTTAFDVQAAAGASPSQPGAPFRNIFRVGVDSSIQLVDFKSTRNDTATIRNLLYTDAQGFVKSSPVGELPVVGASLPANQIGYGTGTGIASSGSIQKTTNGLEIAGNGSGTALLDIGSIPTENGKINFDIVSSSGYNVEHRLNDTGYDIGVKSSGRDFTISSEAGLRRMRLDHFGKVIFGENNSTSTLQLNAGTLNKRWSFFTGSTPNPTGGESDESIQVGINIVGSQGYNPAYNTFAFQLESNFENSATLDKYEEFYFKWIRASTGVTYRNLLMLFNEFGGTPAMSTTFLGKMTFHPTRSLVDLSTAPTYLELDESGKLTLGNSTTNAVSKFEVWSNATTNTMQVGSTTQDPSIGFFTGTGASRATYAETKMQNISSVLGAETGRLLFNLRNNGVLSNKFTMHEKGLLGVNKTTPTAAVHILDANFVGGLTSTSVIVESNGLGGLNGDGSVIGFRSFNGTSDILGFGLDVNSGFNAVWNYFGTKKMNLKLASGVLNVSSLSGTGNRVLVGNASGDIVPLAAGVTGQVLTANGVWADQTENISLLFDTSLLPNTTGITIPGLRVPANLNGWKLTECNIGVLTPAASGTDYVIRGRINSAVTPNAVFPAGTSFVQPIPGGGGVTVATGDLLKLEVVTAGTAVPTGLMCTWTFTKQ